MKQLVILILLVFLISFSLSASGNREDAAVRQYSYEGVDTLVIQDASIFEVEIRGQTSKELNVNFVAPAKTSFSLEQDHRGSGLFLTIRNKRISLPEFGDHKLVLSVPEQIDIEVESSTGSILIDGCNGSKSIQTTTGVITVRKGRGDVRSKSTTGGQEFREIVGAIDGEATTGSFRIEECEGSYNLRTTTGEQTGRKILLTGDSTFRASTGSIRMDLLNPLSELAFRLESTIGKIELGSTSASGELFIGSGDIEVTAKTTTGSQSWEPLSTGDR